MTLLPFPEYVDIASRYQTDDIYDFIGQGTFASVYKAVSMVNTDRLRQGDEVALKVFKKSEINSPKDQGDIVNEVEILKRVNHPNCVRLLDYFQTPLFVVIVMSLVPGKELFAAIRDTVFTEVMVRRVMQQLLSALNYLHSVLRVVHRDIKPENVLVSTSSDGDLLVTLLDFGLARSIVAPSHRRPGNHAEMFHMQRLQGYPPKRNSSVESLDSATDSPLLATPCGTLKYAAPETVRVIGHAQSVSTTKTLLPRIDIYSAGILMYVMLSGTLPFQDFTNKAVLFRDMEGGPDFSGSRWDNTSSAAVDLCRALLSADPHRRPQAVEALRYPWFSQMGDATEFDTQRAPVDAIIGKRELVTLAFEAMQQSSGIGGVPALPMTTSGSRCKTVPFQQGQPEPDPYFQF